MWDPTTYLTFGDERARPFDDLLARVSATAPRSVVDLGCGPGTLTAGLARRWPEARVVGLDSSPEMIAKARALPSTVEFKVGDVRAWEPGPDTDVVVSNATLHWVPDHEELLIRWAKQLTGWLAVQVPGNYDAPSHQALRDVAAAPRWRDRLPEGSWARRTVPDPTGYADLMVDAGFAVDAWETTYLHLLPVTGAEHPVLAWMEGTALRPVRSALPGEDDWTAFRDELRTLLARAYPVRHGLVAFPFRRVFFVACRGSRPAAVAAPGRSSGR